MLRFSLVLSSFMVFCVETQAMELFAYYIKPLFGNSADTLDNASKQLAPVKLDLSDNKDSAEILRQLDDFLKQKQNLTELNLDGCEIKYKLLGYSFNFISTNPKDIFSKILKFKNLKILNLKNNNLSDECMTDGSCLLKLFYLNLEQFDLSYNELNTSVKLLTCTNNTKLKTLNLSYNKIDKKTEKALKDFVKSKGLKLEIDFYGNDL
jgi:Ran GTPase-activating protein (RanGAP) involved in mRNA processing and transport